MSITTSRSADGSELLISIKGRFDFSSHQAFRDAYEGAGGADVNYKIDMSETTYLDSSALGMLLLLRDYAGVTKRTSRSSIAIRMCTKILTVSNFEQLFKIVA